LVFCFLGDKSLWIELLYDPHVDVSLKTGRVTQIYQSVLALLFLGPPLYFGEVETVGKQEPCCPIPFLHLKGREPEVHTVPGV
jgi:hypothetical protein